MSSKGKIFFISFFLLLVAFTGLYVVLQTWYPFLGFILLSALLSLGVWIKIDQDLIIEFFKMRTTKNGFSMGALILAFVLILASINIIAVKNSKTFDYSLAGQYTLSEQTKKLIKNLDTDLNVKFFYKSGSENVEANKKAFKQLVQVYQELSGKVKVDYLEMNENPKATQEFGANRPNGEAFLEYKGKKNRIESQFAGSLGLKFNEQDFTNALIKATRVNFKTIYFIQGHQEREFENEKNESGLFSFKQLLEKNSFKVNSLNLASEGQIPNDASAVAIMGPQTNFQKSEISILENYLFKGGALFITLDQKNTAGLNPLLDQLGLKLDQHYVFNVIQTNLGPVVNSTQPTIAVDYSNKDKITQVFTQNQTALFIKPNSISIVSNPIGLETEVLIKSPKASVALLNLDSEKYEGEPRSFNLAVSVRGPFKENASPMQVVVFADTDFLSNSALLQNVNRDLGLNSISALVKETDLISISPKEVGVTLLKVTPPEFSRNFQFLVVGVFFPLPFLFLALGALFWFKNRNA